MKSCARQSARKVWADEQAWKSDMNAHWLQCFEEQNVQFIVLNQSQDRHLVKTLRRQPEWSVDFEADGAVIFARSVAVARGAEPRNGGNA
jgi:hypothetical protein